jgi:hypothetical protein
MTIAPQHPRQRPANIANAWVNTSPRLIVEGRRAGMRERPNVVAEG